MSSLCLFFFFILFFFHFISFQKSSSNPIRKDCGKENQQPKAGCSNYKKNQKADILIEFHNERFQDFIAKINIPLLI